MSIGTKIQMTSNQLPELCVYCGRDESFGPMDTEHFVAKVFWSKSGSRPDKTRVVPAHTACNKRVAGDSEYFRDILAMEEDAGRHPEVQKLLSAELKLKLENRRGAMKKTLKNLRFVPRATPGGLYIDDVLAFDIDWRRIERVLHNILRGIYFTVAKKPLPQDSVIRAIAVTTEVTATYLQDTIELMVPWQSFGDDVFRCRYITSESVPKMHCLMQFYRHRFFFLEAMPKWLLEEIEAMQGPPEMPA